MHWHKEFELNVILEGEGDFVTGDIHFTAYKGDIVLTPPDMLHAVYQHDDKRCVYDTLDLDGSMLGSRDNDRAADAFIAPLILGAYSIETGHYPRALLLQRASDHGGKYDKRRQG